MLFALTIATSLAGASALPEHLGMHPQGHGAKATLDRAADDDPGATRDSYAELSDRDKEYFRRAPSARSRTSAVAFASPRYTR